MSDVRERIVDLARLTEPERDRLLRRVHALQQRVFRGIEPFEAYCHRVETSGAKKRCLWLLEDAAGELVGSNLCSLFELEHRGETIAVLRMDAGLLPEHRGNNRIIRPGIAICAEELVRHPGRRVYVHIYISHVSGYVLVDKYFPRMYPSPRTDPPPAAVVELIELLNARFGPALWREGDPWVVRFPVAVEEAEEDRARRMRSDRPAARYYAGRNPEFLHGAALAWLLPVDFRLIADLSMKLLRNRIRRSLRPRRGSSEGGRIGVTA